jgi:signal transduction histidine kinase
MRSFTIWSILLAVLVMAVFNVHGWLVLRRTSRALESELGDRLQSVAQTLALELAGKYETPDAERLLGEVMRGNGLFNLFIVDENISYLANTREPGLVGKNDPVLALDEPEIASALSGIPAQSRVYAARGSYLKTAYVPLQDSLGLYGAVLGAEADARFFAALAGYRNSLLLTNALSLAAVLALVLLSLAMARRALRIEQAAARANTLALMGQMSAAVAHEIKNPLAVILAAAERLEKRPGLAGEASLAYIKEEVDRLNRVLTNYLSLGSQRPDSTEPVDLNGLVRDVLAGVEHSTRKQSIAVEMNLEGLPPVTGNRLALRQVFLNLILNAIQVQPNGGIVRVTGTEERHARSRTVSVRIEDHGTGIRSEDRRRVFEPFYTTREKGSGLGLFVVRRVVEQHRGKVSLEPRPGGGTVVEVRLPV